MGWRNLLQEKEELIVLPWLGGRTLRSGPRAWHLDGKLPAEHGWYTFKLMGRKAILGDSYDEELAKEPCVQPPGSLMCEVTGYLVGDRLILDNANVDPDPSKIAEQSETVHLIEDGLDRFARIEAGRACEDGPLIYSGMVMPLGPEEEVLQAFLEQKSSVANIKGVVPALDAAFRMEVWQRIEAAKRRAELERIRKEEEEKRRIEEKRREIVEKLGDGAGRRAMAAIDFDEAARAAFVVGNAQFLDSRKSAQKGEMVVRFRLDNRRFECTCDKLTLRVIDAGICLVDHRTHEKGDGYFTLESLPGVIRQAQREGKLVVFRRVDGENYPRGGNDDDDEDYDD